LFVLFNRFTPLIGAGPFYSAPINARLYAEAVLTGWHGAGFGATPATVEFTVQSSADLETWVDGGTFSPASAEAEVAHSSGILHPWFRARADIQGSDPGVTIWLVGQFVHREGPVAGEAA
jgi:hypothetical protein